MTKIKQRENLADECFYERKFPDLRYVSQTDDNMAAHAEDVDSTCICFQSPPSSFFPPVNPAFIAPLPLDRTVNETENVTFTCTAAGIPAPTISFYRGATLLDGAGPEEPNPRVTLEDPTGFMTYMIPENGEEVLQVSRTLTISNTMDGDSGNYSCRAGSTPTPDEDEVFFQLVVQSKFFEAPGLYLLHLYVAHLYKLHAQ